MKNHNHYRGRSTTKKQRCTCKAKISIAERKLRQRLKKLRTMFPGFFLDPVTKKIKSIYQHSYNVNKNAR